MRRPPTPEHLRWLKANGHDLGPLTGTDAKALAAIAAVWNLYAYSGAPELLEAVAIVAGEMQASTRPLARELIAQAMDWGDRDRLWPRVLELLSRRPPRSSVCERALGLPSTNPFMKDDAQVVERVSIRGVAVDVEGTDDQVRDVMRAVTKFVGGGE